MPLPIQGHEDKAASIIKRRELESCKPIFTGIASQTSGNNYMARSPYPYASSEGTSLLRRDKPEASAKPTQPLSDYSKPQS